MQLPAEAGAASWEATAETERHPGKRLPRLVLQVGKLLTGLLLPPLVGLRTQLVKQLVRQLVKHPGRQLVQQLVEQPGKQQVGLVQQLVKQPEKQLVGRVQQLVWQVVKQPGKQVVKQPRKQVVDW